MFSFFVWGYSNRHCERLVLTQLLISCKRKCFLKHFFIYRIQFGNLHFASHFSFLWWHNRKLCTCIVAKLQCSCTTWHLVWQTASRFEWHTLTDSKNKITKNKLIILISSRNNHQNFSITSFDSISRSISPSIKFNMK